MIYSGKIEKNKNIVEYLKNKIFLIHKKHLQNNIIEFDNEFFEKNNKLNEKEILNSIENIEDYHKKICRALDQKQIKDDYSKNQAIDMLNNINMFKFLYYSNNNLSNLNVNEKIEQMKRDNYSMFVKSLISREYNIVNDTELSDIYYKFIEDDNCTNIFDVSNIIENVSIENKNLEYDYYFNHYKCEIEKSIMNDYKNFYISLIKSEFPEKKEKNIIKIFNEADNISRYTGNMINAIKMAIEALSLEEVEELE